MVYEENMSCYSHSSFFNYKFLNMGIQGKYVNKKTQSSFNSYKFLNMGIQGKYVSCLVLFKKFKLTKKVSW